MQLGNALQGWTSIVDVLHTRESQRLIKILQAKSKQHFCGGSVLSAEVVAVLMGLASWLRASADSADGHRFESRRTPLFATLTKILVYSDLFSLVKITITPATF